MKPKYTLKFLLTCKIKHSHTEMIIAHPASPYFGQTHTELKLCRYLCNFHNSEKSCRFLGGFHDSEKFCSRGSAHRCHVDKNIYKQLNKIIIMYIGKYASPMSRFITTSYIVSKILRLSHLEIKFCLSFCFSGHIMYTYVRSHISYFNCLNLKNGRCL